jgi:lactate dehydrogenase-like 2-hydroxyacid dehydrogenase
MNSIDLLTTAPVSPYMANQLKRHFRVHERLHECDSAAFARIAPHVRAVTGAGDSRVTGELISQLPALEIISIFGVGYDGVDLNAARERGIVVTHTPDILNDDVADLAIAMMLGVARQLVRADHHVRSGAWSRGPLALGRKLSGARLGLIGMGRIGQRIAARAQAFEMQIAYTARHARADVPYRYHADPEALAAECDYLVVITPGGPGTRKLVDAKVLRALGPRGVLVNVARGSVVDEAALIDALDRKLIAGAALDVFDNEPDIDARLRAMPDVLLTPHIGTATHQTREAMADLVVANLRAHFDARALPSPIPECRPA